ncbi:MAG TPA: class I SAM-dependent methyltransferase [Vicinamibacterales bacterium]
MSRSRRSRSYRYLLGDHLREAARLRAQARLWDPHAFALFDRLGVRRGWRVLEIGPGQGSLHVELRRRVRGPVDAVEPSAVFRRRLRQLAVRDGFGAGTIWETTLAETKLPRAAYDLIFARWVFLFLPEPEQHVRQLVSALKPGGVLAIEDYRRETMSMIPCPPEWAAFMAADAAFFATQGGDASIAGRLPRMFERAGLEVIDITPTIKTGHPGSPVWNWLSTYFLGVMDQLGRLRPLTPAGAKSLTRQWIANGRKPTSLLVGPALIDVVGRKRT